MTPADPWLEIVAAVSSNGVIGSHGDLPWRLPDDLKHFKTLTIGHTVIMGRRTLESIGNRPLPGRRCLVVSRTILHPPAGIECVRSFPEVEAMAAQSATRAFVVGGGVLYAAALPRVKTMHLTEIDLSIEGDAFFPAYDPSQWELVSSVPHPADARHACAFRFCTYERIAN